MKVRCQKCGANLNVPETMIGKRVKCSVCQRVFVAEKNGVANNQSEKPITTTEPKEEGVQAKSEPSAKSGFKKETISTIIHSIIAIAACAIGQSFVEQLPGAEIYLWKATIGRWIEIGLAVAILVLMIRLLSPLKILVKYYVDLIFRRSEKLAQDHKFNKTVSSATLSFVLIVYVALLYRSILPSFFTIMFMFIEFNKTIVTLIKAGFAIAGVVLAIKLVLALWLILARISGTIAEPIVAATAKAEKATLKTCPNCKEQIELGVKFCPYCGKECLSKMS